MKATELRIGNWVKHAEDAVSSSEYPGAVFQWDISHFADLETGHLHIDSIEPVIATEDWLLRFGFVPKNTAFAISISDYPRHERKELYVDSRYGGILMLHGRHPRMPKEYDLISIRDAKVKGLLPVHELQNLFFSLKGEELATLPEWRDRDKVEFNRIDKEFKK